jgi:hypothetical protein
VKQAIGSDKDQQQSDSTEVTDENNTIAEQEFTKVSFCSVDSMYRISASYPTFDNSSLNDSILAYIDESFRGYREALAACKDAQKAFQQVGQASWESMKAEVDEVKNGWEVEEGEEFPDYLFNWEFDADISVETIQPRYITFADNGYQYQGGAHGIGWESGTTFDRQTGCRVGSEQLLKNTSGQAFQKLLRKKLTEYFDCEDDNLKDELFFDPDEQTIPNGNVYLSKDVLVMQYQSYEIAAYAMGRPSATFTFQEIKPFLTDLGLRLIGEK